MTNFAERFMGYFIGLICKQNAGREGACAYKYQKKEVV